MAALLLLQGGIATIQFLKQGSAGLYWMGEGRLDPGGQGISVIEAGGRRWLRAYGMMAHPNVLGGYLSMGFLICLGAACAMPRQIRRWLWGTLVIGGLGLFFTFSRSAWLGTAAGLGYMLAIARPWRDLDWRSRRVRRTIAIGGILLVVSSVGAVAVYGDLLVTRFFRLSNPLEATSIQERIVDIRQAWSLIDDVPYKGTGSGYYIAALWAGVGQERPPGFRKVHNTPLLAAAELGIGGALLWLGMLCAPPVFLACRPDGTDARCGLGWAGAFVSAFVLGLFDSYLYVPGTWWPAAFLGLAAGAWSRLSRRIR
jgi:O-antigen ligase